jgi:hypothetical protein
MDTTRKARKEHPCSMCKGVIRKGQKYVDIKLRVPTYDKEFDYQDGIEYLGFKEHSEHCVGQVFTHDKETLKKIWKNCIFDNHKWIDEEMCGAWFQDCGEMEYTGNTVCEYCGIIKPAVQHTKK